MQTQETNKSIGQRLRETREATGLNQSHVAVLLQVSRQCVGNWESGATAISAAQLGVLAGIYGVSTDYLVFGLLTVPVDNDSACKTCSSAKSIMRVALVGAPKMARA
ncbi:MAG: XRE family transcriptional regulator [Comamonadaceae bacterium]|nr:MAG: XRE family transcriptional regulator [Comamonadaceae bacterium]